MTVPYNQAASKALRELGDALMQRRRESLGTPKASILGRVWEHVVRVALVYAISADPANPVIDLAAVQWADQIVTYCVESMLQGAGRYVADNEAEADIKRVLEIIRKAGKTGLKMRDFVRATRFLGGDRRRQDILRELVSSEQIAVETIKRPGRASVIVRVV